MDEGMNGLTEEHFTISNIFPTQSSFTKTINYAGFRCTLDPDAYNWPWAHYYFSLCQSQSFSKRQDFNYVGLILSN